ncbi:MAG: phthalate 4,5-dioxygenase reductase subunit [Nocardioides sp.]|nr:phthalate 4,5-dioxygenase reductase subunit [Nocardioides sp.]
MSRSTDIEESLSLVVAQTADVADALRILVLRRPDGADLPPWTPGAHVDLELGGLVRQYSLSGSPTERRQWRVAVLREPESRGGSAYVHDKLGVGDEVEVRGPRNHFPLVPSPRYVFVAGGIGVTPLLPMLAEAQAAGADWRLDYGGRSRSSMGFVDELVDAYGDRVRLHPQDEVGLLPLPEILRPTPETLVYCCGPEPLLQVVEAACVGWPSGSLHLERFTPKDLGARDEAVGFQVELAHTGVTLDVPPDRSVLSVLEEAGVPILSSCTEGTCGTCETGVLGGEVDHRDSLLTAEEQAADDVMFVCVSRARSGCPRLVLDL